MILKVKVSEKGIVLNCEYKEENMDSWHIYTTAINTTTCAWNSLADTLLLMNEG